MAEENKAEQKVEEIVEEEYIEAPSKWTFLNYVKGIAHFKWWVIGFSLLGAVVGFLSFNFIVNPLTKKLSTTYTYNLAGDYIDEETFRFIDGTLFNPYDLTNRENLQKVKDGNAKYAGVNIDKIVANNAIVITKDIVEENVTTEIISYTINAKAKYFPNDELGKDYLYDLINLGKGLSTAAINNYEADSKITENFESVTFNQQIKQLNEQYDTIASLYYSLIDSFSATAEGNVEGEKLYKLLNAFVSSYYVSGVSTFTDVLTGQKDSNKFINYVVGQETEAIAQIHGLCTAYIETIKNNENEITVYEDRLNKILASASIIGTDTNVSKQITDYNEKIEKLQLNNVDIAKELNNNGYFLNGSGEYEFDPLNTNTVIYKLTNKEASWVKANEDYKKTINEYKVALEAHMDEMTSIYQYCYSNYQNKISIRNGGYVSLEGEINSFIGAAAGLVAGFLITSLVTFIIYGYKQKEE